MERQEFTIGFCAIATLMAAYAGAGTWQEFAVDPCDQVQQNPAVYDSKIVWEQLIGADYDICGADVTDPNNPDTLVVAALVDDQRLPAIFQNTVVWQDYVDTDWDIYAADINDPHNPLIYAVSFILDNNELAPDIYGNIVVWQDGVEGSYNIYTADVTLVPDPNYLNEFPVAASDSIQRSPAIYRNTVVFDSNLILADFDIVAADIFQRDKALALPVTDFDFEQINPAIWGSVVVWQDDFYGNWDIFAADISDSAAIVDFAIVTDAADQENPSIDDNIIVWQDNRNGNWDIFGYNLITSKEFQITTDPADQINPDISGNLVVWQDKRSGTWNIYAALLDGPEAAKCSRLLSGDIDGDCQVDFYDFAQLATDWLDCGREPAESCWQ